MIYQDFDFHQKTLTEFIEIYKFEKFGFGQQALKAKNWENLDISFFRQLADYCIGSNYVFGFTIPKNLYFKYKTHLNLFGFELKDEISDSFYILINKNGNLWK